MAGKITGLQLPYKIADADGVAMFTGVVQSGEGFCKKPTADNQLPLGVVHNYETKIQNDPVPVQIDRVVRLRVDATTVINPGDKVILGVGGVAKKVVPGATPAPFRLLGEAENGADGAKGELIDVRVNIRTEQV